MNRSLVAGIVDEVFSVEQEIEVLRRLGQEERLHPVFQRVVANILNQLKKKIVWNLINLKQKR